MNFVKFLRTTFLQNTSGRLLLKMVLLFRTNMILSFCLKSKNDLLTKNTHKDNISGIIEKDDIQLRKYGISSNRKIKGDEKAYLVKYA